MGALFNNTIYALPQFAASYAAITENLIPGVLPASESGSTRLLVSLVLFGIIASITFTYENGSSGVVIYERVMTLFQLARSFSSSSSPPF